VCRSRKIFRNEIRDILESCNIVEDGNDVSKLHTKQLLILKPISQHCHSFVIGVGECKWYATFLIFYFIYPGVNNCKDISKD